MCNRFICYEAYTLAQSCSCIEPSLAFATRPTSTLQRSRDLDDNES